MFHLRFWGAVLLALVTGALAGSAFAAEFHVGTYPEGWGSPPGSAYVAVIGDIEEGDSVQFVDAMVEAVALHTAEGMAIEVRLESDGGSMAASLGIGHAIRAAATLYAVDTIVPDGSDCYSGCALIWLAGDTLWAHSNAIIGFHQPYIPGAGEHEYSAEAVGRVAAYLQDLGYDGRVLALALSASPDEVTKLNWDIIRAAGLPAEEWTWR